MTNNLFQNRYSEADQISDLGFSFEKDLSKFSLFSEGSFSYLARNSGLSYYSQDIGLGYLQPLSEKAALYFSLAGKGTFYKPEYNDFNYYSLDFRAALKTYFSETSILKSNFSLDYKNYKYSQFDFLSYSLLISFDKYFQTKTTFKAELNWGYKYFLHPYLSQGASPEPDYNSHSGGMGGHHMGMGHHPSIPWTQGKAQGIQNFSLTAWMAQGIGDRAGIKFSAVKQWTISGLNPFNFIQEFYIVENPSYDNFSWNGYALSSLLTLEIPWDLEMKLGYTRSKREFPGIESMSLDGKLLGLFFSEDCISFKGTICRK